MRQLITVPKEDFTDCPVKQVDVKMMDNEYRQVLPLPAVTPHLNI